MKRIWRNSSSGSSDARAVEGVGVGVGGDEGRMTCKKRKKVDAKEESCVDILSIMTDVSSRCTNVTSTTSGGVALNNDGDVGISSTLSVLSVCDNNGHGDNEINDDNQPTPPPPPEPIDSLLEHHVGWAKRWKRRNCKRRERALQYGQCRERLEALGIRLGCMNNNGGDI